MMSNSVTTMVDIEVDMDELAVLILKTFLREDPPEGFTPHQLLAMMTPDMVSRARATARAAGDYLLARVVAGLAKIVWKVDLETITEGAQV